MMKWLFGRQRSHDGGEGGPAAPTRTALQGKTSRCAACDHDRFRCYKISGPSHYSDHETDSYELCICDDCGQFHLRHVWCEHYDMTGDHDEYGGHFGRLSDEALKTLLVEQKGSEGAAWRWLESTHDPRLKS